MAALPPASRFVSACRRRYTLVPSSSCYCYHVRLFGSSSNHNDTGTFVSIGNVVASSTPAGSGRDDLRVLPSWNDDNEVSTTTTLLSHLRWMLQKDLCIKQDFLLLSSSPNSTRDTRNLLFTYAGITQREVEYICISKDTTDSDLKQRKEVVVNHQNSTSYYVDQAPIRAAIHGRLLILDNIHAAERNVLPTLNNLLENRELSLDDGSMLVSPSTTVDDSSSSSCMIRRVHPDFCVAALCRSDSHTAPLDPPLRSRFQARVMEELSAGEVLEYLSMSLRGEIMGLNVLKELVQQSYSYDAGITTRLSNAALLDAARYYLQHYESSGISIGAALRAHGTGMLEVEDVSKPLIDKNDAADHPSQSFIFTPTTRTLKDLLSTGLSHTRIVALVGDKGVGKSALARQIRREEDVELFSLYRDLTARDLLLTRSTDTDGTTTYQTTPLTRAVQKGTTVILDGIDKLHNDTLLSLALLLERGQVDLPDGTRLQAKNGFGVIGLAHPPTKSNEWITPEIANMFHWIRMEPLPSDELKQVLSKLYPAAVTNNVINKLVKLRDRLDAAIKSGAADTSDEQETLVLSLRKLKHIGKRVAHSGGNSDLAHVINATLLTELMPERERRIVESCMTECGIVSRGDIEDGASLHSSSTNDDTTLDPELIKACRRTPKNPLLVPDPVFEENPGHAKVLRDILDAHSVGERALLIMGYQGVGKNRVVDFLLSQLQCEREYLQLHRDTTVQTLLSSPSVEDGRLVYGDSPLVRAAKFGRILVADEADKSPTEVVALLKGLIEDGELALPDGRILRYNDEATVANPKEDIDPDDSVIWIHPDFRIWALANPAGYPFHGNDLSREMADVFSCHFVPPLDAESQTRIIKRYGPRVSDDVIATIISIWQDLSQAHRKGVLAYPFSVREAVSVVRHLEAYPDDGLDEAIENVIAFDRSDNALLKQLGSIFGRHGVNLLDGLSNSAEELARRTEGGISTPRTRTEAPKHGKVDPDNTPHVGGNTWAGGTGGSDTAGLGGRGGPYRLDSGHPVHQVSDEMKAEVTEEAQRRARQMAEEALEQKLNDLNMGKLDWERYDNLRERVAVQIQQLQVLLKDIQRRKEERVWLRRQSHGEIDDSRLVDALAGERDVFKRRGMAIESSYHGSLESQPMRIKLLVDVSASMYRFNGYDRRLERLLEATLMVMEAIRDDSRFELEITGHNGDSAEIPLLRKDSPRDPATQLRVLESMVAHTQYTLAGDSTLEAMDKAIDQASDGDLVVLISDANLRRYRIEPEDVSSILRRNHNVHTHLIFVGSMGEEAHKLARAIPNERAQVCLNSEELPLLLKSIVASAAK
jgi:MoxR-like ATPase